MLTLKSFILKNETTKRKLLVSKSRKQARDKFKETTKRWQKALSMPMFCLWCRFFWPRKEFDNTWNQFFQMHNKRRGNQIWPFLLCATTKRLQRQEFFFCFCFCLFFFFVCFLFCFDFLRHYIHCRCEDKFEKLQKNWSFLMKHTGPLSGKRPISYAATQKNGTKAQILKFKKSSIPKLWPGFDLGSFSVGIFDDVWNPPATRTHKVVAGQLHVLLGTSSSPTAMSGVNDHDNGRSSLQTENVLNQKVNHQQYEFRQLKSFNSCWCLVENVNRTLTFLKKKDQCQT